MRLEVKPLFYCISTVIADGILWEQSNCSTALITLFGDGVPRTLPGELLNLRVVHVMPVAEVVVVEGCRIHCGKRITTVLSQYKTYFNGSLVYRYRYLDIRWCPTPGALDGSGLAWLLFRCRRQPICFDAYRHLQVQNTMSG